MTPCPLCQHPLYHESPPLVKLPPLRVYCDGCQGWLAWEPTDETRRVQAAPLCPACKRPMALKNLRAGGLRFGCETWKACQTGMRPEEATVAISVPVYRLVGLEAVAGDKDAARFSRAWEKRQGDYDKIREREGARERRFRFDRGKDF